VIHTWPCTSIMARPVWLVASISTIRYPSLRFASLLGFGSVAHLLP
jgi:hypothetical protein